MCSFFESGVVSVSYTHLRAKATSSDVAMVQMMMGRDCFPVCSTTSLLVAFALHKDVYKRQGHEGTLTVIKDLHMKEPYVGTIDLLGGEIAEDVAGYFVESEQIPTACGLGVLVDRDQSVKSAGGYLIQLMPGATEDTIVKVEGGIMAAGPVSALLEQDPNPEHLLRAVMSDFDLKILETQPVSYKCYCSRERVERALISLGRQELEDMIRQQGGCQLSCQFCDTVYDFSREELEQLLASLQEKK